MARSVADVRALFAACCAYDPEGDPFSAPVPYQATESPKNLRIGVMEQFLNVPVQEPVRQAVLQAAALFRGLGHDPVEFRPRDLDRAPNVWAFFFTDLPSRQTARFIAGRESEAHWTGVEFLQRILATPEPSGLQVVDMLAERDRIRLSLIRQMRDTPLLLLPVCGVPAFRHRERKWDTPAKKIGLFEAMMPVTAFNLAGFPGLTVPLTFSPEGLPIGIQLIAKPFCEELLLAAGEQLEQARGPLPGVPW